MLEVEDAAGECLVVPADTVGWIGTSDVALEDESVLGALVLRCGLGLLLDRERLGEDRKVAVGAADLERARTRRRQALTGEVAATTVEQEVDVDPDYRDWCRTLVAARDEIVRVCGGRIDDGSDLLEASPALPVAVAEGRKEAPQRPVVVPHARSEHLSGVPPPAESPSNIDVDSGGEVRPPAEPTAERTYRSVTGGPLVRNLALAASIGGLLTASFLVGRTVERQALAGREGPEIAVPWLLAPLATRGGEPEQLAVPVGARSIALLIDGSQGDQLEIRDAAGEVVWSATIEAPDTPDEDLVVWPASRTPPGDYEVFQLRDGEVKLRFTMRIESQ